jgi:acetyl esterase/lipase
MRNLWRARTLASLMVSLATAAGALAQAPSNPGPAEQQAPGGPAASPAPGPVDQHGRRDIGGGVLEGGRPPLPAGVRAMYDVAYGPNKMHKLDLYLPQNAKGPVPLVIWIHPGNWWQGSKFFCPALSFVADGFAAASIDYRLTTEAEFPANLHDCKLALRFLRSKAAEYNINSNRVGVWGNSAGGHLAALLATTGDNDELHGTLGHSDQSNLVQAAVIWFAPTDLTQMESLDKGDKALTQLLGGPLKDRMDLARLASPISHVSKGDGSFLFVHGDDPEQPIPVQQSQQLHDALVKAGATSEMRVIKGQGHGFKPKPVFDKQVTEARNFFARVFNVSVVDRPADAAAPSPRRPGPWLPPPTPAPTPAPTSAPAPASGSKPSGGGR